MPRTDPRIATAMRTTAVPIAELRLWDRNPHTGDVAALQESLRRFGQVTPIVRAPDGWIIAGNTTLKAMIAEGYTTAACVTLNAEEAEQIAFGLASNQTARLGTDDDALVLRLLEQIGVIEGTGYADDDLSDLRARIQEMDMATGAPEASFFNPTTGMREGEQSLDERLAGYTETALRSMILNYELPMYEWIAEASARAREQSGDASNADLFVTLLAHYLGEAPPS